MAEEVTTQENTQDTAEATNEPTMVTEDNKPEELDFRVGDTVRVLYKIVEGDKERTQPYEGIVISKKGMGISKTFTVRRIAAGQVGVERIFPLHSPNIVNVEVVKKGKVRRSKLYYLRGKKGKAATFVKERKDKVSK